jgi:hypothetical protein
MHAGGCVACLLLLDLPTQPPPPLLDVQELGLQPDAPNRDIGRRIAPLLLRQQFKVLRVPAPVGSERKRTEASQRVSFDTGAAHWKHCGHAASVGSRVGAVHEVWTHFVYCYVQRTPCGMQAI